jgi:hypothetical protein
MMRALADPTRRGADGQQRPELAGQPEEARRGKNDRPGQHHIDEDLRMVDVAPTTTTAP